MRSGRVLLGCSTKLVTNTNTSSAPRCNGILIPCDADDVARTRQEADHRLLSAPRHCPCFSSVKARLIKASTNIRPSLPNPGLGLRRVCPKAAIIPSEVHGAQHARFSATATSASRLSLSTAWLHKEQQVKAGTEIVSSNPLSTQSTMVRFDINVYTDTICPWVCHSC